MLTLGRSQRDGGQHSPPLFDFCPLDVPGQKGFCIIKGLVRNFTTPGRVWNPKPVYGAMDVLLNMILNWTPADGHYIGIVKMFVYIKITKKQFSSYARKYPIIKSWSALPGIGIIRAATIFAYLDTPWRFKNRAKLHR